MSTRHSRPTLSSLVYWIAFCLLRSAAIPTIAPRHDAPIRPQA